MNKIRKFVLLCLILSATTSSEAQIGIKAGFSAYNVITRDKYDNEEYNDPKLNPGFHVGITYDLPIAKNVFIQTAALFGTKGYRMKRMAESSSIESYMTPYYAEIPVNLLFAPKLGKGRLLLGAGPYVAYGFGGKGKYYGKTIVNGVLVTDNQTADLQFVNDFKDAKADKWTYSKPLDYGIQLMEGYEFNGHLSIQVFGQLGLADLKPSTDGVKSTSKIKNYGMGVSLGYIF